MVNYYSQEQSDLQAKEIGARINKIYKTVEDNKLTTIEKNTLSVLENSEPLTKEQKNILNSLSQIPFPATVDSLLGALNEALLLNTT